MAIEYEKPTITPLYGIQAGEPIQPQFAIAAAAVAVAGGAVVAVATWVWVWWGH